ncbi:hypothetical protein Tco_1178820 [Tanacetum coccineum]
MAFIQLGGNSRVDEMILARVSSGFAGQEVWEDIQVVPGFLGAGKKTFWNLSAIKSTNEEDPSRDEADYFFLAFARSRPIARFSLISSSNSYASLFKLKPPDADPEVVSEVLDFFRPCRHLNL